MRREGVAAARQAPVRICPRCLLRSHAERPLAEGVCLQCGFREGRTPEGAPIVLADAGPGAAYYEDARTRDEYLAFHYPDRDPLAAMLGADPLPPAVRYPFALASLWDPAPDGFALDVGAACGRVTFDLARSHREAWGLDRSVALVDEAARIARDGRARYRFREMGDRLRDVDVRVEAPRNVRFLVGDALALPAPSRSFATVAMLNVLDRVPDPAGALAEAARVTAEHGVLLVGSPYTWLEAFTPRGRWLDGPDAVRATLGAAFQLEKQVRIPFFIAHHARSGQLAVAVVQRFRRIS